MPLTPSSEEGSPVSPSNPPPSTAATFLPRTPQDIAIVICALGIVLAFFAPWVSATKLLSGATLHRLDPRTKIAWIVPVFALAVMATHRHRLARRWFGTAAAIIIWLIVGYCIGIARLYGLAHLAWGEELTANFCLGLFAFCGDLHGTKPIDFVAKKLSSRKAEVYSHSWEPMADCHFSTKDFYERVGQAIRAKQWPGVELLRIDHFEAGPLSPKREYLRVVRQRQVFDICAATFGKDYFFSVREAEIPSIVSVRAFLVVLITLWLAFSFCVQTLGFFVGLFGMFLLVVFAVWFLFNILKLGLTRVDSILLQLPAIGPVYEAYFRRDTYFQQDTRVFFIHAVSDLVRKHVEETTSAQGLRYLDRFDSQPVLDGLYKRSRVDLKTGETAPVDS